MNNQHVIDYNMRLAGQAFAKHAEIEQEWCYEEGLTYSHRASHERHQQEMAAEYAKARAEYREEMFSGFEPSPSHPMDFDDDLPFAAFERGSIA